MKIQNPKDATAITPSDTVDIVKAGSPLYIGVTGDVKVTTMMGTDVTFTAHPVGYMPVLVRRVWDTGTTATNINSLHN